MIYAIIYNVIVGEHVSMFTWALCEEQAMRGARQKKPRDAIYKAVSKCVKNKHN